MERVWQVSSEKSNSKREARGEKETLDVYYHGAVIKHNMMVKQYNGYELGIWFFKDHLTGQAIITSIWKR